MVVDAVLMVTILVKIVMVVVMMMMIGGYSVEWYVNGEQKAKQYIIQHMMCGM